MTADADAPMDWGFYPLWFWNGNMTEAEIRWQVGEMAAGGFKGFFIHPRQGLRQPYLSGAYFFLVAAAVDEAKRLGLSVHIGDEYPYPSGAAGGMVALGEPQLAATQLVQTRHETGGRHLVLPLPRGKVLACVACPLDIAGNAQWGQQIDLLSSVGMTLPDETYQETGLTSYNRKRYFANRPTPTLEAFLPDEPHRIYVSVQVLQEHHKYWGFFPDVMNPAAVERFIALTHQWYARHFRAEMGISIRSFFMDETGPSWSALVPAEFQRRCGYDVLPLLPALQDASHPRHLQVLRDLSRVQYEMFTRSFDEPIARWCREHRVANVGEKPSYRLSQLRHLDVPGCEPGHTKAGAKMDLLGGIARGNARATASAAYFYGKSGSMCECYHSLGWGATLQDARLIAEGLLLLGVKHLVPHAAFYSTHALRKHDAPPSFFFQMPWWPQWPHLARRVERIGRAFEGTRIDARVLVVDPSSGLPDGGHCTFYQSLLQGLAARRIDFLVVDTDILQAGSIEAGAVTVRDVRAEVVVVPPMRFVEDELAAWLTTFKQAGGTVIEDAVANDAAGWAEAIARSTPPAIAIASDDAGLDDIQAVRRTDGNRTVWLLLNTGGRRVKLRIEHPEPLREIALDDELPPRLAGESGQYTRTIAPFESVLLTSAADASAAAIAPPTIRAGVAGLMRVAPLAPNVLRLYEWEMSLPKDSPVQRAKVPAVPLVNQLAKGGFRISPRVEGFFGDVPQLNLPTLCVLYEAAFENRYAGAVELVMEPETLVGEWSIRINGGRALGAADFVPSRAHVRGSVGVDITPLLQPGPNTIAVTVETDRMDGGLRNALYLAGGFGVELTGTSLVAPPTAGEFENYSANRLPHYAGVVEYSAAVELAPPQTAGPVLVEMDLPGSFEDACEVSFNGGPWHAMPWSPRLVQVDAAELRRGPNDLRLRVYTTLIRSFEGQFFDVATHAYRDVR